MEVLKPLGTGGATTSVKKSEEPIALGRAQIPHASFNHGSALLMAGDGLGGGHVLQWLL
jgi:hypothetical protein